MKTLLKRPPCYKAILLVCLAARIREFMFGIIWRVFNAHFFFISFFLNFISLFVFVLDFHFDDGIWAIFQVWYLGLGSNNQGCYYYWTWPHGLLGLDAVGQSMVCCVGLDNLIGLSPMHLEHNLLGLERISCCPCPIGHRHGKLGWKPVIN